MRVKEATRPRCHVNRAYMSMDADMQSIAEFERTCWRTVPIFAAMFAVMLAMLVFGVVA
ncbi:MAG: hypothetical protein J6S36_03725 [Eggerthellaceae bacterium]|nr:hypothetical protein [Eggerthellaceae bacterium]